MTNGKISVTFVMKHLTKMVDKQTIGTVKVVGQKTGKTSMPMKHTNKIATIGLQGTGVQTTVFMKELTDKVLT